MIVVLICDLELDERQSSMGRLKSFNDENFSRPVVNGENPKVIQELLRHANLKVTMDTYVQAVSDEETQSAEQGRQVASAWYSKKGSGLA